MFLSYCECFISAHYSYKCLKVMLMVGMNWINVLHTNFSLLKQKLWHSCLLRKLKRSSCGVEEAQTSAVRVYLCALGSERRLFIFMCRAHFCETRLGGFGERWAPEGFCPLRRTLMSRNHCCTTVRPRGETESCLVLSSALVYCCLQHD